MRLIATFTFILALLLCCSCSKEPEGARAFVSNERDGTITVINTATDKVVQTIQVGARPRGIRLSPDGKLLYVALSYPSNSRVGEDKIAAIDTESGKVVAKYDAGTDPEQFALSLDGTRFYIANEDAGI